MRAKHKPYRWSKKLAYAVGLITTDGSLSKDGRHFDFTSKDLEQIENFCKCLDLHVKIGKKNSGSNRNKIYFHVQFGDVILYKFLNKIGLTSNKTKTVSIINIPDKYFIDFLRGHLDGDGCTYSYWDPRWKSSFMLYTVFSSASIEHLTWLKEQIRRLYDLEGKINYQGKSTYTLKYAKKSSELLLKKIYYNKNLICLSRKLLKINQSLGIIHKEAGVEKLVNSLP